MKKSNKSVMYTQKLIGLNSIIHNCPGKSGLRLSPVKTYDDEILDDIYDVSWDGKDLDLQAMMFRLSESESPTDSDEDSFMIQFSVTTNKVSVFFGFRLSEDFTSADLFLIANSINEVIPYVKDGIYSVDDLMTALYRDVLTDDDTKNIRMSIAMCSSIAEREIYPQALYNYDKLVESGVIKDYLPNQLVYSYSNSDENTTGTSLDYTYISRESGAYFKIDGETENLIGIGEMTNAEMYKAKLESMRILIKEGKDNIIKNLPSFLIYVCDDVKDDVKPEESHVLTN